MENNDTSATPAPATAPAISMASLLKKTDVPSVWVEYKEGISFQLSFVPKARFKEMVDKCTEMVYSPAIKARQPQLNGKKFFESFLQVAVKDWKGVTPDSISRIAPINVAGLSPEQLQQVMPYSQAALMDMIEIAYELDTFIQNTAMDLNVFRPSHADEVKN